MMGAGMMTGNVGLWTGVSAISWVILIAGVITLIVWAARSGGKVDQSQRIETALDILKKRFARGEITTKEFEDIKKSLSDEK